ncbi:unnamed protein product, partial [Amoebophrya sp. A25]|eukprot:GSA25T00019721001.1
MTENESKRKLAPLLSIKERNLGMNTDDRQDKENKLRAAWKAHHALKGKLCGAAGISLKEKGGLVMAMSRTVMTYGLQSRSCS